MAAAIDAGTASKKDIGLVGKLVREHSETWRGGFLDDVTLGRSKAPVSAWAAAAGHAELAHVRRSALHARGGADGSLGTRAIADALDVIAQWAKSTGQSVRSVVVEHASKDKMPATFL
jgi:hypothetical protein